MRLMIFRVNAIFTSSVLRCRFSSFPSGTRDNAHQVHDCDRSVTYHYLQREIVDSACLVCHPLHSPSCVWKKLRSLNYLNYSKIIIFCFQKFEPTSLAKLLEISLGKNNVLVSFIILDNKCLDLPEIKLKQIEFGIEWSFDMTFLTFRIVPNCFESNCH